MVQSHVNAPQVMFPTESTRHAIQLYQTEDSPDLVVRFVRVPFAECGAPHPVTDCGVCGRPIHIWCPGPRFYLATTDALVCFDCARQHAPELAAMVAGFYPTAVQDPPARNEGLAYEPCVEASEGGQVLNAIPFEESTGDFAPMVSMRIERGRARMLRPGIEWLQVIVRDGVSLRDTIMILEAIVVRLEALAD